RAGRAGARDGVPRVRRGRGGVLRPARRGRHGGDGAPGAGGRRAARADGGARPRAGGGAVVGGDRRGHRPGVRGGDRRGAGGRPVSTDVLLVSADRPEELRWSLPAALAQDGAEVLVVDAGREGGTAGAAREHGARLLEVGPASWAAANNAAIAATGAREVLLLNADCFLAPEFLTI